MRDVVISLFDVSGKMIMPWLEAGYECWIVDTQHPPAFGNDGITSEGNLHKLNRDLSIPFLPPVDKNRIAFISAFPPCDHLSISGARWYKGKGLRKLQSSIGMFATAAEFCEWSGAPYFLENPVSSISSYWRIPLAQLVATGENQTISSTPISSPDTTSKITIRKTPASGLVVVSSCLSNTR
jgi:hypothetical protein